MKAPSGRTLPPSAHPRIVAIVNVTPDSYYDGGRLKDVDAVVHAAERALAEGADILEIGGESSGPGSKDVSLAEELKRVLPAIGAIRRRFPDAWIAVDTWKEEVARQAMIHGADLINDVTAGRGDPDMFRVIADCGCPCVLMYSKDPSARTTVDARQYDDVIQTIHTFLGERIRIATTAGVDRSTIIVDPGLGHFVSSDPRYSFEILRRLRAFTDLGPVLVSPSRKSFLAGPQNLPPNDRLAATLEATTLALKNGVSFIRTHDVGETRRLISETPSPRSTRVRSSS